MQNAECRVQSVGSATGKNALHFYSDIRLTASDIAYAVIYLLRKCDMLSCDNVSGLRRNYMIKLPDFCNLRRGRRPRRPVTTIITNDKGKVLFVVLC